LHPGAERQQLTVMFCDLVGSTALSERLDAEELGDFNRAFDRVGEDDNLWREIDDGTPAHLDVWRLPFRQESDCWRGTGRHHPRPIDFLVLDDRAWRRVEPGSFRQVNYEVADRAEAWGTPSDHCPIAVDLRLE
jgi:hypothetical protein